MRAVLVWLLVWSGCGGDPVDELVVDIDTGTVRGRLIDDTRAFLGIPYAAPPVGPDRFRPPRPAPPLDGVLEAKQVSLPCPQSVSVFGAGGDEDCLYLNVWTPRGARDLPVMVWLHGGAFILGSGSDPYYDGGYLARTHGVVVVTVNYRLAGFGFLAHPALTAEDPGYPSSGNYGIEDQLAALAWVQTNIAGFGGDPARVLLFGESAGGLSTCLHYAAPRTEDLFFAAIAQSGLCTSGELEPTLAEAEAAGVAIAEALGCTEGDVAACLRGKSVDEVLAVTGLPMPVDQLPGGPFYQGTRLIGTLPNVDGHVIPRSTAAAFAAGDFAPRPLVIGNNRDEGTLFHSSLLAAELASEADYRDALARRFGAADVDAIVARYPVAQFPSPNRALAEVTGDALFVCPARRAARGAAAAGAPVYLYSFEREPDQPFLPDLGVFHSAEIPFLFNTDPRYPLGRVGSGQAVADTLQGYWARFARAGDPNGDGAPAWPAYDAAGDRFLVIDTVTAEASDYKAALCDFWDAFDPAQSTEPRSQARAQRP